MHPSGTIAPEAPRPAASIDRGTAAAAPEGDRARSPTVEALVATALGRDRGVSPAWLYLDPRGRIGRATFWRHGVLALLGLDMVAIALMQVAGVDADLAEMIATWGLMWPLIALSAKRWHDVGRSGWFVLVNLIPVIGQLIGLVVNGFVRGTRGPNAYGPDPLARGTPHWFPSTED